MPANAAARIVSTSTHAESHDGHVFLKFRMISVHSHPHPGRTRISFNNRVIRSTVFLITRKRVGRYMSNVNLSRLVCNFCSFFIINYYKFDIGDMRFGPFQLGFSSRL
ncbi:MAG: hypothetical protein CM1200mP18_09330 [Gammaproteobacteria bacterium]|nr:MAG: hypothetical protein CM1200mP18_09330 [Gammaproteobacteria bacterium]